MRLPHRPFSFVAVVAAGLVVAVAASAAHAGIFDRSAELAEARRAVVTTAAYHAPGCCKAVDKCGRAPCIDYRYHRFLQKKVCCGCEPPAKVVLQVKDPCCCYVEVPVCVPACCKGDPKVSCGKGGLFNRGTVTYEWCCGYKIKIEFEKCGDLKVHYYGL
jgi:hypothetical protein